MLLCPQHERFYVLKNQMNTKYPMLWKLEGDKLQKFEPVDLNGGQCFGSTSVVRDEYLLDLIVILMM